MTEIPEHLLKRSKERRSAMGLPGGEGGDASAASSAETSPQPAAEKAPVAARSAVPAVAAAPPPPKPDPAYVAAAKSRHRIPFWAMPVIALLPVWGVLYYNSVTVPPVQDEGLVKGEATYAACSGCHGAAGQGGVGAQLNEGMVLKTFKNPKDMMMWLHLGAAGGARPDGSYGDPDREGGPENVNTRPGVMPAFPDLSAEDLANVTRYVRESLSGEVPAPDVLANYPTLAQEAIDDAKAGKLPSSEGDAGVSAGPDKSANTPDGNATKPNGQTETGDATSGPTTTAAGG